MATFNIQSQSLLPLGVQRFLDERNDRERSRAVIGADDDLSQFVAPRWVDGIECVDAFIALDHDFVIKQLHDFGIIINAKFDGFVTAQVPVDKLVDVCRMPGVKDVEISKKMKLCTDVTMSSTHVNQVLDGRANGLPMGYDGSGVIVGVIDMGFDFQHRAFRSNDDPLQTRIVRFYSTSDNSGHKANYNNGIRLPGSVFMGDEIYALTTDKNSSTHGTHTASIAAGSHVNGYGGMAPGADIVMCAISSIEGSVSEVEIANCVRYIDAYADSVGKPCVMSLSINTSNGQRDGMDYFSKVVKQTTGPGRIFVIAAGNNAGNKFYTHGTVSPSSPLNVMFSCKNTLGGDSTYYYASVLSDIWMRKSSTNFYYKFHVLDKTTGKIVWESEQLSSKATIDASELDGYYTYRAASGSSGYIMGETSFISSGRKYRLEVTIQNLICQKYTLVNGVRQSRYALGVTVYPRKDITCDIDAWVCNIGARFGSYSNKVTTLDGNVVDKFYSLPSDSCCIGNFAVSDSTISAGAYSARNSYFSLTQNKVITDYSFTIGDIASFSSYQIAGSGPTGKALPDICAPGTCVVAAASRYSYLNNGPYTVMTQDGSSWGMMSGTSMAAPTVAGIIALWLQANPNLSVADIKSIFAQTAVKDNYTAMKQDQFGPNGKIDALEGIKYIIKQMKPQYVLGDINNDGVVSIDDVTDFIRYLLKGQTDGFNLDAADILEDGRVDINDLTALINLLLTRKVTAI